jgi:tRNA A-37 threonylcarbamoyl transferase component Bud32
MAEVWLAARQGPGAFEKQLVVKQLLPHLAAERAFSEMFLNEARLAAQLNHPNIAQVFDLGEDPSGYFMVMEYVDGRSLRDLLQRLRGSSRPLEQTLAAYVVGRACAALHHAHELRDSSGALTGLVHRDVTPENILTSFGGDVKVVDFGIAKATSVVPSRGTLIGKWPYMSPEQATGTPIDRRADVYALAVVAYELLAGRRPFDAADPVGLTHQITRTEPPQLSTLVPDLIPELGEAIHRALRKDPAERTPDARVLGAAMDAVARAAGAGPEQLAALMHDVFARAPAEEGSLSTTADTVPLRESVGRAPRSRRFVAAGVVNALLVVAGASVCWARRCESPAVQTDTAAPVPAPESSPDTAPAPSFAVEVSTPRIDTPRGEPTRPRHAAPRAKAASTQVAPGTISVRVHPWADVLLDGAAMGTTPLPAIAASPGKHTLVLVNGKLKITRQMSVDVPSGKNVSVEVNLLRQP